MTNPLGKVWSYDYDANNQLITETDPLGIIGTVPILQKRRKARRPRDGRAEGGGTGSP